MATDSNYCFQPYQIVALDDEQSCLYAEVIQIIEIKQSCWVRPLVLADFEQKLIISDNIRTFSNIIDLRWTSDLILPISVFRTALDTEILPLWTYLSSLDLPKDDNIAVKEARHQLQCFIRQYFAKEKT